jgi:RNA polymerase sigma factor (TIGR02999 family)
MKGFRAMESENSHLTEDLNRGRLGDQTAMERAISEEVYRQLKRIAGNLRGRRAGDSLVTTELVHEAYLRVVNVSELKSRKHFQCLVVKVMRQVLVDHFRAKSAQKRGAGKADAEFKDSMNYSDEKDMSLIRLDDAVKTLAKSNKRQAKIVELKSFGLTFEGVAKELRMPVITVRRQYVRAIASLSETVKR